ncbi:MAG TPA: hypothetical protein DHW61_15530 [Lachnoclostridium phytofermentans]|uniref:Uncharacterized protein n=1 Tax=Lachnoclostridium phytofermentans TaxID=66219 RepID=A0A3D2X9J9_9FIRM|nr:hypothetical protein [Lachnoclostridium phytofermentans]
MPKMIEGIIHDTGLPIDGHTLLLSLWDWDNYESYHLSGWGEEAEEAVMETMHQETEGYNHIPLDEFKRIWIADKYEPDGVYCIPIDKVKVVQVMCEEHEFN